MDKKDKYWQLFLSTFKLSACTFGGGFVIIPLMRERFVKELRLPNQAPDLLPSTPRFWWATM